MSKLLYIEASPRKDRSASIAVAHEFLDAYQAKNPGDEIDTIDLWYFPLPEFTGDVLDAKYAILHGQQHTPEQVGAWHAVVNVFDRFTSADGYLFSLPMWNFGIPYKLKHLIDVLTQPGLAFNFSPETGYTGLVTGRPATVIHARGGEYPPGSETEQFDLQKRYMDLWLGFIGLTEIQSIVVEPTLDQNRAEEARQAAIRQARAMGADFGEKLRGRAAAHGVFAGTH